MVIASAFSEISATLLLNGQIAYESLNVPLDLVKKEQALCNISCAFSKAKVLEKAKWTVWDECTMAHKLSL